MTTCSFNEPILRQGDQGNAVQLLQTCLQQYSVDFPGLTPPLLSPGPIDGDFGPKTEASLKSFQTAVATAPVDGIAGPITWSQLDHFDSTFPGPGTSLSKGATGNAVRLLQRLLFAVALDPGGVDGIYGPNTAAAVAAFQKNEGLPQTGNADAATTVLFSFVAG